jgi:outer membrane protein TolC
MKITLLALMFLAIAGAEVRTMALREAVAVAMKQNPDLVIARLNQLKAQLGVDIARDPFVPKLYAGSGAAWTTGYPVNINGEPPSIFVARTVMSIYNRPQSYAVAQARENARGAETDVAHQQNEVAYRVASMYLEADQAARGADIARRQVESMRRVQEAVQARVAEGRELTIQGKRAALNVAKAEQRAESLAIDQDRAERALAVALGFTNEDRVRPAAEGSPAPAVPVSEEAAIDEAVTNSKEVKVIESQMQAKNLEIRGYKAQRLPTVDLIAQYNLLAKYNFEDILGRQFQRHNGQLGASITIPLLTGSASKAYVSQSETDLAKLRAQLGQLRSRIETDTRKAFQDVHKAEVARNVARLDLDVAREQMSIILAQSDEGRVSVHDVEQARIDENEKWIAYYEAQNILERAKLNLLRETGTLSAALQ